MLALDKVKGLIAWPGTREQVKQAVQEILGPLPAQHAELQVKTVDEMEFDGYVRRRVNYFVDQWDRISGWLFLPEGKDELPAILCLHQRVRQGKDEPAGMAGDPMLDLAVHYCRDLGYVTFAPDCPTAGERRVGRNEAYDSRPYYKNNPKLSLAGKMLSDHIHALDLLQDQKRVDGERIGVIGHGLGGMNSLLLTAFDDRVRACVASCGFTRFAQDKEPQHWWDDNGLSLLPKLEAALQNKTLNFDWEHILSLGAPSPTLVVNSTKDMPLSNPKSAEKAVQGARQIYKLLGADGAIDYYEHNDGPVVTSQVLEMADDWFDRWL